MSINNNNLSTEGTEASSILEPTGTSLTESKGSPEAEETLNEGTDPNTTDNSTIANGVSSVIQPYFIDPLTKQEFTRDEMVNYTKSLLTIHDLGPPFTIQRFAELLLNPNAQYPRNQESKFLLALTRVLNVASSTTDYEAINVILLSEQKERELADQRQRRMDEDDDSDSDEDLFFSSVIKSPKENDETEKNETDTKDDDDKINGKSDGENIASDVGKDTPQPSPARSRSNSFNVRAGVYPPGTPSTSVNLVDKLDSVVVMSPIPWLNDKKSEGDKHADVDINELTEKSDSSLEEKKEDLVMEHKDKSQSDGMEINEIEESAKSSEPAKQELAEKELESLDSLEKEKDETNTYAKKEGSGKNGAVVDTEKIKSSSQELSTKKTEEQAKDSESALITPTESTSNNSTPSSPLKRSVDNNETLEKSLYPVKKQSLTKNKENEESISDENEDNNDSTVETDTAANKAESSQTSEATNDVNNDDSSNNTIITKPIDDKRIEFIGKDGEKRRRLGDEPDQ